MKTIIFTIILLATQLCFSQSTNEEGVLIIEKPTLLKPTENEVKQESNIPVQIKVTETENKIITTKLYPKMVVIKTENKD